MNTSATIALPDLRTTLNTLSIELDRFRIDPGSAGALREAAIAVAESLAGLRKPGPEHKDISEVMSLARGIWGAGVLSQPARAEDLDFARRLEAAGPMGLLGATLFTPCWQWEDSPSMDEVPDWLWAHFVDWVFVEPCSTTSPGAADLHLQKLEALAAAVGRWAGRNRGAACVSRAIEAFQAKSRCSSPFRSNRSLREWSLGTANVIAKFTRFRKDPADSPVARPREGTPLRVGIYLAHWGESMAARAWLPRLLTLNPDSISLHLFSDSARNDALEIACRKRAEKLHVLPPAIADGLALLRSSRLDVLIFGGPLSPVRTISFALHRIAPLQIATDESPYASGLPEIDLHLTGNPSYPAEFTEKLALLPEPGFVWDSQTARFGLEVAGRAEIGLPPKGPVFVSGVSPDHLSPETCQAWVKLLQANPDCTLLLLPPGDTDTFILEQVFSRLQAAHGLASGRFVISLGEPRLALKFGDVYLDTFPYSAPIPLMAALDAGLPVIAWRGLTHRSQTGAGILAALGLNSFVASSEAAYTETAQRLVRDAALLAATKKDFRDAIERRRGLGDSAFESHYFCGLLLHAYDLKARGEAFPDVVKLPDPADGKEKLITAAADALAQKDPQAAIRAATGILQLDRDSGDARALLGRAYLMAKLPSHAVACFLSGLRGREREARSWIDLGTALRANRDYSDAIVAYKTGLRLDYRHIDAWIALAEMARAVGADTLAEEAIAAARRIDPNDAQLAAFAF